MMNTAEAAKFNMVEQQMRPWEILDQRVLNVVKALDRADFVKISYKGLAYADCQIPCGSHARMFPPTIEGRMLQSLLINKDDSILEIGSGSGYITACLATLGKQVLSVDINQENLNFAQQNVEHAGLSNVEFRLADGLNSEFDDCYDVIAVTGSVAEIPENLKQALTHGGRLFIIEGQSPAMQALLVTRIGDAEWTCQSLFETDLPALQT